MLQCGLERTYLPAASAYDLVQDSGTTADRALPRASELFRGFLSKLNIALIDIETLFWSSFLQEN